MIRKPNILLFLPDGVQQRGVYSDDSITPHLDRLRERGTTFMNAYTPNPVCSPARASLMTGLLPHNHGVLQVEHCLDQDQGVLRKDKPHWAQKLSEAGYKTGYFGKWHFGWAQDLSPFGWQEHSDYSDEARARMHELNAPYHDTMIPGFTKVLKEPEGYPDALQHGVTERPPGNPSITTYVDEATNFLNSVNADDRPWCCGLSFTWPNQESPCSLETWEQYDPDHIELPPNIDDKMAGKPAMYTIQQRIYKAMTHDDWRQYLTNYYARITEVDDALGQVLSVLEENGQLENTIVIYASDHGRFMGSHGLDCHHYASFEEAHAIPLVMAGPGIPEGETTGARVGLHDLGPTLLEMAGAQPIGAIDSRSFAPVLDDPDRASDFMVGYAEDFGNRFWFSQRIVWEGDWKFVFYALDIDELYNLNDDPYEMDNLIDRPEHRERYKSMMGMVWRFIHATGDTSLINSNYLAMRLAEFGPEIVPELVGQHKNMKHLPHDFLIKQG